VYSYVSFPSRSDRICSTFNGWRIDGTGSLITGSSYRITADTDFHTDYTSHYDQNISTAEQFNNIRDNPSGCYKLTNHIDLTAYGSSYDSGMGWSPIGTNLLPFTGGIDGNGYEIRNLYIDRPSATYVGLFGYIEGKAEIRNLIITSPNIIGGEYTGGIAGRVEGDDLSERAIILSSSVSGGSINSMSASTGYAGGIVGYASEVNIYSCYNDATISSTGNSYVGGIAGRNESYNYTSISNSHNNGSVSSTGNHSYVGGISGEVYWSANNRNTGSVASNYCAGGISGIVRNISNSYNEGNITSTGNGDSYAGGIAGCRYSFSSGISGSYNIGKVNASSTSTSNSYSVYAGGIVGTGADNITSTYNIGLITATSDAAKIYAGGIMGYLSESDTTIKNNVSAGASVNVTTTSGAVKVGRIFADAVASATGVSIENNFAFTGMTTDAAGGFNTAESVYHGVDKTELQLKRKETYSDSIESGGLGWLFGNNDENPWTMDGSTTGYPILYWQ
jgi:hypothetical protein